MSYEIEAFAGRAETMSRLAAALGGGRVVPRPDGFAILFFGSSGERYSPHFIELSAEAAEVARVVSQSGPVAYFECVSMGQIFKQSSVVWDGGELALAAGQAPGRINLALQLLGVSRDEGRDEFDSLGLGEHRSSYEWI